MEKLPFIPNHIYNRQRDIHDIYKGNRQGGISHSAEFPFIFIFSGISGHQHGYEDGWDNPNIFSYTGEGQVGDMRFIRGNLALRDHVQNGKRVFLFEGDGRGNAKFICEVEVIDVDYFQAKDRVGNVREAIKFFFKRKGVIISIQPKEINTLTTAADPLMEYGYKMPNKTERKGLVTSRVGQGAYRKRVIYRWEGKCAVTKFDKLDILIASHIVPWNESTDNEKLDVHNGILLSPDYDALFDKHFITFENNGKILLSDKIETQAFAKIGVIGNEKVKNFNQSNFDYLERHRIKFNEIR
jgi:5-methylcytosine-specific restriction protein A